MEEERTTDPVEVVPHGRREARPQLREGGPEVTGEAFLRGAHWRGRLSEDPVGGVYHDCVGDSSPVDVCQRASVGVLRCGYRWDRLTDLHFFYCCFGVVGG